MRKAGLAVAGALLLGASAACGQAAAATLESIGSATYSSPTHVASDPRDPNRLFVTEQPGMIQVTTPAGTSPFLDLEDEVLDGGERGLWSMAFAPDFAQSGLFYVAYSEDPGGALTLDEYREQATPAQTEATRREVLAIANNAMTSNHNGGQLQFGPDGYLYWSTGEDANAANAQTTSNLLGKILRIDPRGALPGDYTVPPGNPYVGVAGEDEIWSWGLRNPWRFSFDRLSGALVIGDVGGGSREEVDYATQASGGGRGVNYGWPTCEGFQGTSCSSGGPVGGLTPPIYDYASNDVPCNAITGGYVVRDSDLGDLFGRYLFTDSCVGELSSIDPAAPPPFDQHRLEGLSAEGPVSFGEDACGRLYIVAQGAGRVSRIEGPTGGACPPDSGFPPSISPDTDPPKTTLRLKRKSKRSERATAILGSDEPGSTFECRFERHDWKPCGAKRKLEQLDPGRHRFRARATDLAGNTDPTPAKKRFKVG